ncbi:MAG: nuclear transport factor 2 family protein [Bacteroidales bacterium]|nr:nuclear transport factor 2 family protein [Bacteroidales bacterium]MCF8345183.1 nuclear transport factor 2 family protein [Bacteroidales bacterium]MCF8350232.1 nuclear transport factor 2 family protein [Bacteroidales bacterium]MCF8375823.1 nuclear transport factor 2 family protein [Bacteroidales bacterium]MCF8401749.1 nuclear transport factor 2 family protein [Bacteroidales bacterium]
MTAIDIPEMFGTIDRKDSRGLLNFMKKNAGFRFSNIPEIEGRENIFNFLEQFFGSVKALKHDQLEYWQKNDRISVMGRVSYTRHDDSSFAVPFSVVLEMDKDKIKRYLIFSDASQLYTD